MNPRPMSATAKLSQPGAGRDVHPIVLQIVEGTFNSIEAEIEYAERDHEIAVGLVFEDLAGRRLEAITYGDGVT